MFHENIAVLKNHIEDLEAQLKRLEEKKVKSSGAKARSLLLKIKTLAHEMRKDVLTTVKDIPTKSKKKVVIAAPAEDVPAEPAAEAEVPAAPVKKSRGRPKKQATE